MGFNTFPCNPYPISTEELNSNKANQITIAPFFNAETAYTAGDLVYYNGLIYRCTNDHEGEWDADDFAATTVSSELATLKNGLIDVNSKLLPLVNNLKVVVLTGTDRKIKITRSAAKQCFFIMTSNNYHPFFGIISELYGATNHLQAVPTDLSVTASLSDNTFEFTLDSYFGDLTIISNNDFTVTAEPVT